MYISKQISSLQPSATVAFTEKAKALKQSGRDVIVLAAGEPDFTPPASVREAVAKEALEGPTTYGPTPGYPEVREAMAGYLERIKGLKVTPDQIVFTNGAKHAIFNAASVLLDPGDEVILPSPYWVTYMAVIELLGGVPSIIDGKSTNGFKITPDELRSAITDKTRCLIFNNPSNPSGAFYTADEVRAITETCVDAGVAIISDEVYDEITYGGGPYLSPAAVSAEAADLTALVGAFSKTYAMPGWRIGYLVGPQPWIKKVTSFQGQATHHPSSLAQAAALACIRCEEDFVGMMMTEFRKRRDYLLEAVRGIPGFRVDVPPEGAFYLMVDATEAIAAVPDVNGDIEFAIWLLEEAEVGLVPGEVFGANGFLRISYAASMEDLEKAVEKITAALSGLGI
ncbi:pyridoxal phosphate-dependent aminotransferase [Candidatus Zixiibacteriota bacterium]